MERFPVLMPLPIHLLLFMLIGWVSRQQAEVIEYLKAENRALREKLGGKRLRFTDAQRRLSVIKIQPRGEITPRTALPALIHAASRHVYRP